MNLKTQNRSGSVIKGAHLRIVALLFALNALFLAGCVYQHDDGSFGVDYKATVNRSEKGAIASSIQSLSIDNQFGPVVVTGADADFGWDWSLKCQAATEEKAKAYADNCRMEATEDGSAFRLVLSLPKGNPFNNVSVKSELHVRVPKTVKAEVKNSVAPIEITDITGATVKVRNQNGQITLKSISGSLDASTSFAPLSAQNIGQAKLQNQNGSINAEHVGGDFVANTSFAALVVKDVKGTTTLGNQNGEIQASDIAGAVDAHTSFGHMRLENTGPATLSNQNGAIEASRIGGDLSARTTFNQLSVNNIQGQADLSNQNGEVIAATIAGNIKARTSFCRMTLSGQGSLIDAHNQNGMIEISVPSSQTTKIDAETSFASIELNLPEKSNPLITAETSFGKVQSDFPVIMKGTLSVEKAAADPSSPKVTLKTHNGDIHIRKFHE
jgi:DUF4097 and DUF4098 domain-containing protein YvlB